MFKSSPISNVVRPGRVVGFTLVEMLVSVAIVLLMMTMFAQIFQMATGSLSQQRGIAENDQRARMLTSTLRGDLDQRTFRDVFPFRANEDTRQLGNSLARRAGYFEIDENDPLDDTDDVLQFTASVNIRLQKMDGSPFVGRALALSGGPDQTPNQIVNETPITGVPTNSSFTISGDYSAVVPSGSHIWIAGSGTTNSNNNGRYTVSGTPTFSMGTTTITVTSTSLNSSVTPAGWVYLSESEPEFDDGLFGNDTGVSGAAEICYFLRNGVLYRRVLLIREPGSGTDAQPTWTTGSPILWNTSVSPPNENYPTTGTSSFWRDFDYSAYYFPGKASSTGTQAPGVRFHSATESLSNSSQAPLRLTDDTTASSPKSFPISLGLPYLRFGHGTNGLPQDGSSSSPGGNVTFRRFNLQECSNSKFGYPGNVLNGNPMNRTDLTLNPNDGTATAGLVTQYSDEPNRRGEDILMSNVLSFDVKVWDPVNRMFVDVGENQTSPPGPFHQSVGTVELPVGSGNFYGRLNQTYGANGHYRFDTWHPSAGVGTFAGNDLQPPYMPVDTTTTPARPFALSAIQIKINYRDISSGQIRQVTIVQSLIDRVKRAPTTNEAPEE